MIKVDELEEGAVENNCVVCANLNLAADPTCAQSVAAFDACGVTTTAAICGACADYAFGEVTEECNICLKDSLSDWAIPTAADVALADPSPFVTTMGHMTTCGASSTASASCPKLTLAENFVSNSDFGTVFRDAADLVADDDDACTLCVYYQLALANDGTDAFTCAEWVSAIAACSDGETHTSTLVC